MTGSRSNPKPGDSVVLRVIPDALLDGLEEDTQNAIKAIIGKSVRFNEIDEHGRAELQFTDAKGIIHFIWVDPELLTDRSTERLNNFF